MALAFRLYGKFYWPPKAEASPLDHAGLAAAPTAEGAVEIHYAGQDDGDTSRRAFLRWCPKAAIGSNPLPELPSDHLFNNAANVAADWFKNQVSAGKPCAVWLDGTPPQGSDDTSPWLVFRGGFLLEQYTAEDRPDPVLNLQWPLVTQCEYSSSGGAVYSVLGICRKPKPLFYFNLHLPLPVRRTSLQGSGIINATAFPFSAVYDLAPRKPDADELLRIDTLVAGWTAKDGLPDLDNVTATSFPLIKGRAPGTMRLGEFDFAEYNRTPKGKFASYNRPSKEESHRYWPLNRQAVVQDILWPYGFSVSYDHHGWLNPTRLLAADSSLRFPKRKRDGKPDRVSSLVYRATVVPYQNVPHTDPSEDFQTNGSGPSTMLRLRLKNELGGRRTDGIQFGLQDTPDTEAKGRVEGWLTMGQVLSADCELSWDITPDKIWSEHRDIDWLLRVAVRLHWPETVASSSGNDLSSPVTPSTQFASGLLREAGYSFRTVRDALESGEAGQPHSFLPDLANPLKPQVRFSLYGSPIPVQLDAVGNPTWGRQAPRDDKSTPWARPPMRLSLADPEELILGSEDVNNLQLLKLRASKLTFFQQGIVKVGTDVKVSRDDVRLDLVLGHDHEWPPQTPTAIEDGDPFFASFAFYDVRASTAWRGRLGSLQFSGSPKDPAAKPDSDKIKPGYIRIGGRGTRLGLGGGAPVLVYPGGRIAAELSLRLPTAWVEPIGVDVARNDRSERPAPLLIPLNSLQQQDDLERTNTLWLTATETLSPTQDRSLKAALIEDSQETGDRSYVVLSSEPFTIFRFTHRSLFDRGDAGNASVAEYSGDDRIWQYKRVSEYYHYVLPPQVIGESADKPRRLEIHDLSDDDAKLETPPRPFLPWKDKDGNPTFDGTRRRAVEFRLTPSAEIWIRPSDVERGYFMPESTSYEIFRQRGEYGIGAALGFLRAEFLYGLPVGVDVSKEHGGARGARVAEIEALTGKLTGRARDAEAVLSARWNALRSAVARRPERLEVWARDLDSTVDFAPARFSDGAQFALRHTALHRAPVIDQPEIEADYQALPKVAGVDQAKVPAEMSAFPRHHPHGLSGGALWPVESLNLFKTLLRAPQSSGGVIEQIALSPTGGDAAQKAEFLGGKVTIISETRNGYVQRQQVEVLGRICAFWHRAKHVVVYERTVNLPAQFAPRKSEDPNETRSRRPILRKVREYIELLQPERNYPDFTTATQRSTGFLERVRFNSKIINVDSAWASDVGTFGWQIPLWNRLSARERPQVYPMPDIVFVSACEGEGEKPVVAQECLDPDYLYFFADVSAGTSADTDTWGSLLDLDFPNMPIAQVSASHADKGSEASAEADTGSDGRRRAVGRILPGLRRFTWRLAPAAQKAAINAGRAEKPVYAGLDSVSFMRATHAADSSRSLPDDHLLVKSLQLSAKFPADGPGDSLTSLKYWDDQNSNPPFPGAEVFTDKVQTLVKALRSNDLQALNAARKALTDTGQAWITDFKDKAKAALPKQADRDKFSNFMSGLKAAPFLCGKLKTDAVGMIQRKEMLIRSAMQDWIAEADATLKKIDPYITTASKSAVIAELQDLAVKAIRPVFDEASQDIGNVEDGVEKARAVVVALEAEIESVFQRAQQRVQQFVSGYDQNKPWSDERHRAFRAGVLACVSNLETDIAAAIEEACHRLGVELNDLSQAIGGHVAKLLQQTAVLEAGAIAKVTLLQRRFDQVVAEADASIQRLAPNLGTGKIDELIVKVNASNVSATLKANATAALGNMRTACNNAATALNDARAKAKAFDNNVDQAAADVTELIKAVSNAVKAIGQVLADDIGKVLQVAKDLADAGAASVAKEVEDAFNELKNLIDEIDSWLTKKLSAVDNQVKAVLLCATQCLDSELQQLEKKLQQIPAAILPMVDDLHVAVHDARDALAPNQLLEAVVKDKIVGKALAQLLAPLPETIGPDPEQQEKIKAAVRTIRTQLDSLAETVGDLIRGLTEEALGALDQVSKACSQLAGGISDVEEYFKTLTGNVEQYFDKQWDAAYGALKDKFGALDQDLPSLPDAKQAAKLLQAARSFGQSVRSIQNDMSRATQTAQVFAGRVFNQFGKLTDGGVLAAPSNILKLYSAVTTAPEIAALKADIDRIRSSYDELSDVVQTTKANALFNRLGDELKALGLSLPFDKIGDRLMPADLSGFDIAKVFRNFGGTKLDSLLKGYKIPSGVSDAVRVTHDFDKTTARAWVQVDIDAPMAGRRSLFSIGVFKADFVDMRLTGQVRLDASKDQDKVTETGYGRIGTMIDMVVGGQSMVRFEKFALNFTRESGLKVEFDPKNIRLNPTFQFIQDFLGTLFPDKVGGLEIIKRDGIPVGVQHTFALPPMALNFGTSGVSNISIANHFKLLAFPDFLLADRFNLSTVERPFIFSIFIIGGTGYIQIEAEYRPFDSELTVTVEAGAGGSASLAFAFGPFTGQVFITLSGALTYRKVIGKPGGGLSISAVLVIAGLVDVAGIVTVGIVLMLRMTYRDSGQIDADGTLTVEIRISKFFKITARANATYKMRGGKSATTVSTDVTAEPTDPAVKNKIDKLQQAAKTLEAARH